MSRTGKSKRESVLLAASLTMLVIACTPMPATFGMLRPDDAVANPCSGTSASPGVSLTVIADDEEDAFVQGAVVTLLREATQAREAEVVVSAVTDFTGFASVLLTEAGTYEVRIALPGFYETHVPDLRVESGCHVDLRPVSIEGRREVLH